MFDPDHAFTHDPEARKAYSEKTADLLVPSTT